MMKKLLIVIAVVLIVLVLGIVIAPARLASNALETAFPRVDGPRLAGNAAPGSNQPEIRLLQARGTLWDGSGQLLVNRQPIGNLSWQVLGSRLLSLEAAVDWQLSGEQFTAQGTAAARNQSYDLRNLHASFSEQFLRNILAVYEIAPGGTLEVENLDITGLVLNEQMDWPKELTADGNLRWSGGPVRYRLSGQNFDIDLPPLHGLITSSDQGVNPGWPELLVTNEVDGANLLSGRLTPTGSAAIGITRGFTRLAGQPWPGSEPDHAIVLEVEEQLN